MRTRFGRASIRATFHIFLHSSVYSCAVKKRSRNTHVNVSRFGGNVGEGGRFSSVVRLDLSLEGLFPEVGLDLFPEHQHAQVGVGGLVHGFGLDAHAVLLRRQLVSATLLVPEVEQAGHRGPDHDQVAPEVLPVQVDVLHAPAFHLQIKPTWGNKIDNRDISTNLKFLMTKQYLLTI